MRLLSLFALLPLLIACRAQEVPASTPRKITCFSGGQKVYETYTVGEARPMYQHGTTTEFEDRRTGKYVFITLGCVVTVASADEVTSFDRETNR